ncbi:MAG TPA: GNAT family N-acetyltransferase [Planctomycetota bacterium]|nr:GNAT family N-acetyltransferase [Planctomycetota bacterium]
MRETAEAAVETTTIRSARPADRSAIESVLERTGAFSREEIAVALELFDLSMSGRDPSYRFLCAENEGELEGYVCFGEIPLTRGSFDLYWIAVDPRRARRGTGRALVARVLEQLRADGGRKVYVETSSRAPYAAARAFYAGAGFTLATRLSDFYAPGDDKLVFELDAARSPVSQVR